MAITPLPTPPSRSDAANFSDRADAFLGAFPVMVAETNDALQTIADNVDAAQAAAATAINAAGTNATSTTPLSVTVAAKVLDIQQGKNFAVGQFVVIAATGATGTWMHGQVTAHDASAGSLTVAVGAISGTGSYSAWSIGPSAPVVGSQYATLAQVRAGAVADRAVSPETLHAASAFVTLTEAATITPDLAQGFNFILTLTANRQLALPVNMKPGQSGVIRIIQGSTGRTLSYGTGWKIVGGTPSLSTSAGSIDLLSYIVVSSTRIEATFSKGVPA